MEREIHETRTADVGHPVPLLEPGVRRDNDSMPKISKLQIDLLVSAFLADASRVASMQFTNSVGEARFTWLGIPEGQHGLSHEPDSNKRRRTSSRASTPGTASNSPTSPGGSPRRRSPTARAASSTTSTILWTNELGQGNSHSLDNIPFVLVGNGLGFRMGARSTTRGFPTTAS